MTSQTNQTFFQSSDIKDEYIDKEVDDSKLFRFIINNSQQTEKIEIYNLLKKQFFSDKHKKK